MNTFTQLHHTHHPQTTSTNSAHPQEQPPQEQQYQHPLSPPPPPAHPLSVSSGAARTAATPNPRTPTNMATSMMHQHFQPPPPLSTSPNAHHHRHYHHQMNYQQQQQQFHNNYSSSPQSPRRPAYLLHRDLIIGKGSYGQVCIASRGEPEGHSSPPASTQKRKKFACKCVILRNDSKYISKLQEEVNVLRELRGHPNVIFLHDVFCIDKELFIITELGRGGDLFHLLTTHPKHGVTEDYAAKTIAEMLSAIAFLHSRGICHRDLKLENWVLSSGKNVWAPLKLIDFGLSCHFRPGQRLSRVVGSSYYVAPEVLRKSYCEQCDLWSLGVIVYMLLSGAPPFYGKNDEIIKVNIVKGEYSFPNELFRDVSEAATDFVTALLTYDMEERCTAIEALQHLWLERNTNRELLHRCQEGARGVLKTTATTTTTTMRANGNGPLVGSTHLMSGSMDF